ncbi:MAG: hypothetical protein QOH60_1449 [Mycobacterium sp.]|jgi:hypothetical protein|nr:hypothetical protein [Mycobacterium sp.]
MKVITQPGVGNRAVTFGFALAVAVGVLVGCGSEGDGRSTDRRDGPTSDSGGSPNGGELPPPTQIELDGRDYDRYTIACYDGSMSACDWLTELYDNRPAWHGPLWWWAFNCGGRIDRQPQHTRVQDPEFDPTCVQLFPGHD